MNIEITFKHTLRKRGVCIYLFLLFAMMIKAQTDFPSEPGQLSADIVITNLNAVYNGEEHEVTIATIPAGLPAKVTYSLNGIAVNKPLHAGTYDVKVNVNTSQYIGVSTKKMLVSPKRISVQANDVSKLSEATDPELTYVVTPGLCKTDILSGKLERESGEAIGTYAIRRGTLSGSTDYQFAEFTPGIFTIKEAGFPSEPGILPIKLTLSKLEQIYDGLIKKPEVRTDVVLANPIITYTSTRNGEVLESLNAGTYKVKVTITADEKGQHYAGEAEVDFVITPRPVILIPDNVAKVYGDETPVLTYSLSEPLIAGNNITGSLTSEGKKCGEYLIAAGTVSAGANYNLKVQENGKLTIKPRPITLNAIDFNKTYGDSDPVLSWNLGYGSLAYDDQVTGTLKRLEGESVGIYPIERNTLAVNDNYTITFIPGQLTVTPRSITASANHVTKPYGVSDPQLTWQLTEGNLVFDDKISGDILRFKGEALGDYNIEQGSLKASGNYILNFKKGIFSIVPAIVKVTPIEQTKIYGNVDPTLTYTSEAPSAKYSFKGSLVRKPGEQVGNYIITQGTLAINEAEYKLDFQPGKLAIIPRTVTVSAHPVSKVYGEADPAFSYSLSEPLLTGDMVTGKLAREEGEHVGTYAIKQGTFSLNSNYTLSYQENMQTITPRTIKVLSDFSGKIYGEQEPVISYVCNDELSFNDHFTGTLSRTGDEHVGKYTTTLGTLAISTDYFIDFMPSEFTITSRPLEVIAAPQSKIYGSDDPELTYLVAGMGLIADDKLSGNLSRKQGENTGEYEIVKGSLSCNDDYRIVAFQPNMLTIEKAVAQITISDVKHIYNRLPQKVTVTTAPANLGYTIMYNGSETIPVEVGSYNVSVEVIDKNYIGEQLAVLEIVAPEFDDMECTKVVSLNGSGENRFTITYDEFATDTRLTFYNSRGKTIYDKADYTSGDFLMSLLSIGTYYYIYTFTDAQGMKRQKKGFVEVVE